MSTEAASFVFMFAVLIVGIVIGWWPLAAWTDRNIVRSTDERMAFRTLRFWSAGATTMLFGLLAWSVGFEPVLPALLGLAAAGVALSIVDLAEKRLPNAIVFPSLAGVTLLLVFASALMGDWIRLLWALAGSGGMFALYFALALISPRAMGMGDVKFALPLGLVLGWFGSTTWIAGLFGAFIIGGIIAIVSLALGRVALHGSIPFGPSMLAGAMTALILVGGA